MTMPMELGVCAATFTVTDACGDSTSSTATVVVLDPNSGFVTGSGGFNSPAGAFMADKSAVGMASFEFNIKYKKNDPIDHHPHGDMEFILDGIEPEFRFFSNSTKWLYIPA
eukprot:CAMPEP_0198149984 /NCGR_PEP_ID=MMETSP1443-20131203/48899_1 /TAXON_ID=186043 /ORGANISM="Entomoneis sp., Strain CCMP2396" /LENGTH=110 /DNA_ID=CAMNT_0043815165 /DNA_START=64 /DNA_END=393 /DNA_ORIENTATION=-